MSDKLSQEELLMHLKTWRCDLSMFVKKTGKTLSWDDESEQAYNQIKLIIDSHFEMKEEPK